MLRKLTTIAAMLIMGAILPAAAEIKFQDITPDKLLAQAAEQDKLAFVEVYATWCPPCRQMESEVFPREDVGRMVDSLFVAAKYNADEEIGNSILNQFKMRYIPSYLIFKADGGLIASKSGFIEPEEFMAFLEEASTKYRAVEAAEAEKK
ncbi:MAG: thioredoxin family protein [Rikenellaceae bacterium]